MKAKVLHLRPNEGRRQSLDTRRAMPKSFTATELSALLRLCRRRGFNFEQLAYATYTVRLWAETNDRRRKKWHLVVIGGMERGWALEGFAEWRTSQEPNRLRRIYQIDAVDPAALRLDRHGNTLLTDGLIQHILTLRVQGTLEPPSPTG